MGKGLPFKLTFANNFDYSRETTWLSDCPVFFKPMFYKRYVYHMFLLLRHRTESLLFLDYINGKHSKQNSL